MNKKAKISLILINITSMLLFLGSHLIDSLTSGIPFVVFFGITLSVNLLIDILLLLLFLLLFISIIIILITF